MSEMPKEIWACNHDKDGNHWVDSYPVWGGSTKYIRADIHEARVTELLESNNAVLERARRAEKELERLKNALLEGKFE